MTTREFIQHLILNGELDDEVVLEISIPDKMRDQRFFELSPSHVMHLNDFPNQTIVDCKIMTHGDDNNAA